MLCSVSKTGEITPSCSQSQGQLEYLPELPEEMWEIILGYLDDSKDLFNSCCAFPIFDNLLKNKRKTWMLELVLPHVFKDLHKSDLLKLRLVCKKWCKGVDNFIESHPSLRPFDEQTYRTVQSSFNYLPLSTKIYDDIAFVNGEQFVDFMATMAGHPRNPFFGRTLRIGSCGDLWDYVDDAIDHTWEGAASLCKQFGTHLWHVEFANYEFSLSALEFYKGISQSLAYLPNVKSLHMNGALDACDVDDSRLLEYMQAHPLPQLSHLESLIFDLVMEMEPMEEDLLERQNLNLPDDPDAMVEYLQTHPEAIQQMFREVPPTPDNFQDKFIATYACQLKKLEIDLPSWREGYGLLLTNLTEIHLKHVNSIPALQDLLLGLNASQLRKLTLSLRCSMKITELFQLLQPLQILYLDFGYLGEAPDDYLVESSNDVLPQNSSLLLLRIKDTLRMNYEFMKSLSSLEHLDIWECQNAKKRFLRQWNSSEEEVNNEENLIVDETITNELRKLIYIVGEGNASGNPQEQSNIWNLLPSLKVITYRTRSGLPSIIRRFAKDSYSWEYICSY